MSSPAASISRWLLEDQSSDLLKSSVFICLHKMSQVLEAQLQKHQLFCLSCTSLPSYPSLSTLDWVDPASVTFSQHFWALAWQIVGYLLAMCVCVCIWIERDWSYVTIYLHLLVNELCDLWPHESLLAGKGGRWGGDDPQCGVRRAQVLRGSIVIQLLLTLLQHRGKQRNMGIQRFFC